MALLSFASEKKGSIKKHFVAFSRVFFIYLLFQWIINIFIQKWSREIFVERSEEMRWTLWTRASSRKLYLIFFWLFFFFLVSSSYWSLNWAAHLQAINRVFSTFNSLVELWSCHISQQQRTTQVLKVNKVVHFFKKKRKRESWKKLNKAPERRSNWFLWLWNKVVDNNKHWEFQFDDKTRVNDFQSDHHDDDVDCKLSNQLGNAIDVWKKNQRNQKIVIVWAMLSTRPSVFTKTYLIFRGISWFNLTEREEIWVSA